MANTSTVAYKLELMCNAAAVQPVKVQQYILASCQERYVVFHKTHQAVFSLFLSNQLNCYCTRENFPD